MKRYVHAAIGAVEARMQPNGWLHEYDSDLETSFYIKEFDDGSVTIQDFDDDGDWGYNVVVRLDNTIKRVEKTFHYKDLAEVKSWAETWIDNYLETSEV